MVGAAEALFRNCAQQARLVSVDRRLLAKQILKTHSRLDPRRYPGPRADLVMRRVGTPLLRARMSSVTCSRFPSLGRRRGFCGGPVLRDARQRPDGGRPRGSHASHAREALAPRASGTSMSPLRPPVWARSRLNKTPGLTLRGSPARVI